MLSKWKKARRSYDDVLISLILQIPGFTDGTAAKTYCSAFPFLGPPLQLSATAPFNVIPQTCP